jgi:tRNA(fMet)-specific endonuclease VapC
MMLLLDTNVCIDLIREPETDLSEKFFQAVLRGDDLIVSSITAFELEMGILRRGNRANDIGALSRFFEGPLRLVDFNLAAAKKSADLAARLLEHGKQLSAYDALISGHAMALGAVLVTADARLIEALDDVDVVNWRV